MSGRHARIRNITMDLHQPTVRHSTMNSVKFTCHVITKCVIISSYRRNFKKYCCIGKNAPLHVERIIFATDEHCKLFMLATRHYYLLNVVEAKAKPRPQQIVRPNHHHFRCGFYQWFSIRKTRCINSGTNNSPFMGFLITRAVLNINSNAFLPIRIGHYSFTICSILNFGPQIALHSTQHLRATNWHFNGATAISMEAE